MKKNTTILRLKSFLLIFIIIAFELSFAKVIELKGTVVGRKNIVLIKFKNRYFMLSEKDTFLKKYRIEKILKDRVILFNFKENIHVSLTFYNSIKFYPLYPPSTKEKLTKNSFLLIKKTINNYRYSVKKTFLKKILENPNEYRKDIMLKVLRNRKGVEISYLNPKGVFTKYGVKKGDLIIKINGVNVFNINKILELYTLFMENKLSRAELELQRRGKIIKLVYNFNNQ